MVGVDARDYSYRRLWRMYVGKVRHEWNMTAQVCAVQYSAAGAKNVDPNEFNPIYNMFRQVTASEIDAGWALAAQMGRVTQHVTDEH